MGDLREDEIVRPFLPVLLSKFFYKSFKYLLEEWRETVEEYRASFLVTTNLVFGLTALSNRYLFRYPNSPLAINQTARKAFR